MTAFVAPYAGIVATLHLAQIADAKRDLDGQLEEIEAAIEALDNPADACVRADARDPPADARHACAR